MYPWIVSSGVCAPDHMTAMVRENISGFANAFIILATPASYGVHRMSEQVLDTIDPAALLELRLFDETHELWVHRSNTGSDYTYRMADDDYLKKQISGLSPSFFQDVSHYREEITQKIDMNAAVLPDTKPLDGYRTFYTTGGGLCTLPIGKENAVTLVSYYSYDGDGRAHTSDFRVSGFTYTSDFSTLKGSNERRGS